MQSVSRPLRWGIALTLVLVSLSIVTTPTAADVVVGGSTTVSTDNTTVELEVSYDPKPQQNTNFTVFVDAKNTGNHTATLPVTLYLNGTSVDNGSITVAPGDSNDTELVTYIGKEDATISVNEYNYTSSTPDLFGHVDPRPSDLECRYAPGDCDITGDLAAIQSAINDWATDTLVDVDGDGTTLDEIQALIQRWAGPG